MQSFDPLWVPVLTHYTAEPTLRLDQARTADHLRHLTPHVWQYLVAGTTGDGWEMPDAVLDQWLQLLSADGPLDSHHQVLIGALADTTDGVIERALRIERHIEQNPLAATFAGLTLCAPVDADADQAAIAEHFRAILAATSAPVAIYQLPQITGCEIAPETFYRLADEYPRIALFKDTSGNDRVVNAATQTASKVRFLRGAEGDYHRHLKPKGRYDGWLLSTANGFAPKLRAIASAVAEGDERNAAEQGAWLTELVNDLFAQSAAFDLSSPFSDVNRSVDHLYAYGSGWREAPLPVTASGERLPAGFLATVQESLAQAGAAPTLGYRN